MQPLAHAMPLFSGGGQVWTWGEPWGDFSMQVDRTPRKVPGAANIAKIACGAFHNLALSKRACPCLSSDMPACTCLPRARVLLCLPPCVCHALPCLCLSDVCSASAPACACSVTCLLSGGLTFSCARAAGPKLHANDFVVVCPKSGGNKRACRGSLCTKNTVWLCFGGLMGFVGYGRSGSKCLSSWR